MTIKSYRNFQKTEEKFIYIIWKYDQFLKPIFQNHQ